MFVTITECGGAYSALDCVIYCRTDNDKFANIIFNYLHG